MKKYTQVKKTINGVEYTAQYNGVIAAQRAADSSYIDGTDTLSNEKLMLYLLENVLVDPKITADNIDDYFDNVQEAGEVTKFLSDVANGTFREETDKTTATAKSKG